MAVSLRSTISRASSDQTVPHSEHIRRDCAAKGAFALCLISAAAPLSKGSLTRFVTNALYEPRLANLIADFFHTASFTKILSKQMTMHVKSSSKAVEKISSLRPDQTKEGTKVLQQGLWYPPEYCLGLKKFGQIKRLEWIHAKGHSYHGYLPKEFFKSEINMNEPFGYECLSFSLKSNIKASDALDAIFSSNEVSLVDCATFIIIVQYLVLKDLFGKDKFDALFSNGKDRLKISINLTVTPLIKLMSVVKITDITDLQIGDLCHFSNITLYNIKHPYGMGLGQNVVCVDDGREKHFLGFGFKDANPLTEQEISEFMRENFNKDPLGQDVCSTKPWEYSLSQFLKSDTYKKHKSRIDRYQIPLEEFLKTPSFAQSQQKQPTKGKLVLEVIRPNVKIIQELSKASIEKAIQLFARL